MKRFGSFSVAAAHHTSRSDLAHAPPASVVEHSAFATNSGNFSGTGGNGAHPGTGNTTSGFGTS